MNKLFDFTSCLLQRFDRFLAKAADIDPEKVRTQKRYRVYTFFLHYATTSFFGSKVLMPMKCADGSTGKGMPAYPSIPRTFQ